jgi:hypothetical protein
MLSMNQLKHFALNYYGEKLVLPLAALVSKRQIGGKRIS